MNILLTGSEGFIGKHLHQFLQNNNHKVIPIDKLSGNDLINCDLKYDVDLVIHLAGLSGVRDSLDRPTEYWKENVIAGQRLFDYFPNTRILYASSSTAVDPWRNPYAMSKKSLESIAPKNSVGMRFTTVYGPGAREHMLIPRILRDDVPFIHTNHTRDFIHINDLMMAIDTLMKTDFKGICDVGRGESYNLIELLTYFGIDAEKRIGNEFEREDNKADNKVLNKLNWSTTIDLYDYIKENKNVN
tara:strand:+ start:288 stop:1019 length:732 start_codon:yes stop_codon:yes gene_type:complete